MTTEDRLVSFLGKPVSESSSTEIYEALLQLVKEEAEKVPAITGDKKVYYISAEFLIGKQLGKNLINLGLYDEVLSILKAAGKSIVDVERKEKEPSLGNGGLGRLAACFLDSIATLNLPGDGVGLNYHYGLFKQEFRDNKQYEIPDEWLDCKSMMRDTGVYFPVELGGKMYLLVTEEEEGDGMCLILRDDSEKDSEESLYTVVEDENELSAVLLLLSDKLEELGILIEE